MNAFLRVLIFLGFSLTDLSGQGLDTSCPKGWVYSDKRCYRFVDDKPRIYEEADAYCWKDGAKLLSIQTSQQHKFVADWLKQNDILPPSQWLTSGYYEDGVLVWDSENSIYTGGVYWTKKPSGQSRGRLAYTYGGTELNGYGWTLVSDSVPMNFICDIMVSEVSQFGVKERGEDYGYGIIDPAEVPRGPDIITQPSNIIVVEESASVYIECLTRGNPYPIVSWFRGPNANESVTSETDNRYTLSGGRLTIQRPKTNDVSTYRCTATNDIGTVMSKVANIQFGYLREFPPIKSAAVIIRAFKGVRLECNTPSYYPDVRYEWFKGGLGAPIVPGQGSRFVSMSGYLYMSGVNPTGGTNYFCLVTLAAPGNYKLTTRQPPTRINLGILVRTTEGTYITDYGPIINTHAFPSPALRGLTIRLECVAYGTMPISYSWKRADGRGFVSGTKISDRGRVLTITNAPLEAEGGYICKAKGQGGVAYKTISLVMETDPYFPHGIGNMFVDPGQSVKWRCKAVARPKATYLWFKDGKLLEAVPGKIEVTGHMLYIWNVQKERDDGMYQCGATNMHGTTFSTGRLKVVSFKPNFDRHPLPAITLAPLGGTMPIPCTVEAAPTPQVNWLKNGGSLNLIPGTSGRLSMTTANDLVISDIQYSDAGTYTCQASNINGDAFNKTYLKVVEGVTITTPPIPTTVQVNNTAFLYCHAAYNYRYDVVYTWKFNGHTINSHLSPEFVMVQRVGTYGLYIRQAQYKNTGVYDCVAETVLHSASSSAKLYVIGPPGPPAGVYVDELSVTAYSARLVWTVGVDTNHGDPVTSFDIEAETQYHPGEWQILKTDVPEHLTLNEAADLNKRADQRLIKVQNLVPHTGYRFRVRAINGFGRGKDASKPSVTIQTPQTIPIIAPRDVDGGGGKVGTLTVTWDPLDEAEHCGPGLGYNIFWRLYDDKRQNWKKGTVPDDSAKKIQVDGQTKVTFTVTVGIDDYYLQYEVKVGAYNVHGDGPNSTVTIIFSAEGMPVAVPKIQDTEELNATTVTIHWLPVVDDRENMKGRVRGYTIQYFERIGEFTPYEGFEPDNIKTKEVYGQTDSCLIIGLTPDTEYYARVQVFNSAGRGPKGLWRKAETKKAPPSDYPTFVEVFPRTEHSVTVRWRGVSTKSDESSLQGYINEAGSIMDNSYSNDHTAEDHIHTDITCNIEEPQQKYRLGTLRVWKAQEDIRTATDYKVDKVMEATLEGLQKQTVYVLRMLGYSEGGDGKLSESVYFTVLGGNIPFDPSTSQICYSDGDCSDAQRLNVTVLLLFVLSALYKLLTLNI